MIRPADPREADRLTDLVLRSKAHWGYDEAFIEACRSELTVTPDRIERHPTFVCERDGSPAAVSMLSVSGEEADLALFFVEPELIGHGLGRRLYEHTLDEARRRRCRRLTIDSDPDAEGFYLRMGAVRVGTSPSGAIPGRDLPHLRQEL